MIVVRFLDEVLALFGVWEAGAAVLGHGDELIRLDALDEQRVENHVRAEGVETLLGGVGDQVGAGDGAVVPGRRSAS